MASICMPITITTYFFDDKILDLVACLGDTACVCSNLFFRGKRAKPDDPRGDSGIFLHGVFSRVGSSQQAGEGPDVTQLAFF